MNELRKEINHALAVLAMARTEEERAAQAARLDALFKRYNALGAKAGA